MANCIDPLRAYAERAVAQLDARLVALFGSRARGDARPPSDYDVAVVSARFESLTRRDRTGLLLELAGEWRDVDPVGFAPEEFECLRSPLAWDILEEGLPIAGLEYWDRVRAEFWRLRQDGTIPREGAITWAHDLSRLPVRRAAHMGRGSSGP